MHTDKYYNGSLHEVIEIHSITNDGMSLEGKNSRKEGLLSVLEII